MSASELNLRRRYISYRAYIWTFYSDARSSRVADTHGAARRVLWVDYLRDEIQLDDIQRGFKNLSGRYVCSVLGLSLYWIDMLNML